MKKRFILLVASILVLTLMVVGCTSPSTTPAPESERNKGKEMLRVSIQKTYNNYCYLHSWGNVDVLARLLAKHAEEF